MKIFSKIAIISWAIYFLISITGISLQRLYCHCAGIERVSIFEIEKKCEKHKKTEKKLKACCAKILGCSDAEVEETHSAEDCCNPKTEYIKADVDLISATLGVDLPVLYFETPLYVYSNPFIFKNTQQTPPNYRPPPERHGSELRDFIQSYLC